MGKSKRKKQNKSLSAVKRYEQEQENKQLSIIERLFPGLISHLKSFENEYGRAFSIENCYNFFSTKPNSYNHVGEDFILFNYLYSEYFFSIKQKISEHKDIVILLPSKWQNFIAMFRKKIKRIKQEINTNPYTKHLEPFLYKVGFQKYLLIIHELCHVAFIPKSNGTTTCHIVPWKIPASLHIRLSKYSNIFNLPQYTDIMSVYVLYSSNSGADCNIKDAISTITDYDIDIVLNMLDSFPDIEKRSNLDIYPQLKVAFYELCQEKSIRLIPWEDVKFDDGSILIKHPGCDGKMCRISCSYSYKSFNQIKPAFTNVASSIAVQCNGQGIITKVLNLKHIKQCVNILYKRTVSPKINKIHIHPVKRQLSQEEIIQKIVRSKSEYLIFLSHKHLTQYPIHYCLEICNFESSNNQAKREEAFIFTLSETDSIIVSIYENISPNKVSIIFWCYKEQYDAAIQIIHQYFASDTINKRMKLASSYIRFPSIGWYKRIKHDEFKSWKTHINQFCRYYR